MYGITNSGKLFADQLTEWLLEAGFIQYQCHMSIYYKFAPYGTNCFVLYYVDDFLYWHNSESPGKWFLNALGTIFHVNFLGYSHRFMSIRISHITDHSIYVYQARYATYIVAKYLDTGTVKSSTKVYKTTFPSDMIFTKIDASTNDEQVYKLTR